MYLGEPIVAVVATSERAAREGAAAVKVTYEDLPHVLDVEEALEPEAPVIKPHGTNYFVYEGHHCRRIRFGDVEAGFAEADHVFEWRYQSAPIEQAPTETTGCIVVPQAGGRLKIHSDTQAVLLHARQHRADPRRAVRQAAGRRRDGRRRLRRQGRRDRRADRLRRGDGDQQAGQVRL